MKQLYIRQETILVDDEDYDYVMQYNWHKYQRYIDTFININGTFTRVFLHHLIIKRKLNIDNIPKDMIVDHIDHNRLNNCRNNLRLVTYRQNCINHTIAKNNTSGFIGVHKDISYNNGRTYRYWCATVYNYKQAISKKFPCTIDGLINAIIWRDQQAIQYYGLEYAQLNFPNGMSENDKALITKLYQDDIDIIANNSKPKIIKKPRFTRNNISGFYGVKPLLRKAANKQYYVWMVVITDPNTHKSIKKTFTFSDLGKEQAAKFFDKKMIEFFNTEAILNFPDDREGI